MQISFPVLGADAIRSHRLCRTNGEFSGTIVSWGFTMAERATAFRFKVAIKSNFNKDRRPPVLTLFTPPVSAADARNCRIFRFFPFKIRLLTNRFARVSFWRYRLQLSIHIDVSRLFVDRFFFHNFTKQRWFCWLWEISHSCAINKCQSTFQTCRAT